MIRVDRTRLPALRPDPPFRFPSIAKTRLESGLSIWAVEHRSLPVVTAVVLLRVGSAADPDDQPGLASLTGDMLDEGADDRTALEVNDALARIGAQFDTEVSPDATILTLTTLARFRDRALGLLGDIVIRPRFEPHEFQRVRQLRMSRLRQLRDLAPAVADRAFASLVYAGHPYGHLAIGTERALEQLQLEDVIRFHRQAYVPSEVTVIVVGDGTHEELTAAAAEAFGSWQGDSRSAALDDALARSLEDPGADSAHVAIVDRPGAAQSELRIGHAAARRKTPDYHALLVLNAVLGGQFVSRINMNLREDKGFTYGARTSFDFRRGPGPFLLQVSVQTDVTGPAIRESLNELRDIRDRRPVDARELELAKASLTRGYPRNFETAEQIARSATQLALHDLPDGYFEAFVPTVAALDLDAVARAAQTYLKPDRLTTVIVGDRAVVEPQLAEIGLVPVTPLTIDEIERISVAASPADRGASSR
ncbi:MAG TPA: pitrilysin family protein [Vicinamibacterales bacterium]|nr:pitrilysin family protein [Vicinamibacterales bacterium]